MTTAPRGAAIGDRFEEQRGRLFSTRSSAPDQHHLAEPLRRLAWLKREIERWDAEGGAWPMPQPRRFGLALPDLKPSEITWPRPRTMQPWPEARGVGGRP